MGVIKDILRTMDYGPSPESTEHVGVWLEEHKAGFGHFINGVFTKPGALFDVFDPARGERIARVSQGSAKDIDAAVTAARIRSSGSTAVTWATRSARSRVRIPVPAPISRTSAAPSGISQSSASFDGAERRRLYSTATSPKDRLRMAEFSS